MTWANPSWLWFLAAVPLLIYAFDRSIRMRKKRLERFAVPQNWSVIAPEVDYSRLKRKAWTWIAAFVFLTLALARPQWGVLEETVKVSGLDLMVAVDVSNSMMTEDVPPNRLKRARFFLRTLVERLSGDRVGVVAFAASSYLASPLTNDLGYINDTLEILDPKAVSTQGSDLGNALDTALRALDRGSEEGEATESAKLGSKVVVLISDGEDHEQGAKEAAERLKAQAVRLYVFGVGTEMGGPVPVRDSSGQLRGYKRDRSGGTVQSKMNPAALEAVAQAAGGRYWTMTESGRELTEFVADLGALARGDLTERKVTTRQERYQIPLALGLILLFAELFAPARRMLRKRKEGASWSGKLRPAARTLAKGAVVLAGLSSLSLTVETARAADWETYRKNEEGLRAYEQNRIDEAKRSFGDAQAHSPASPELRFNQGSIEYKAENWEKAAEEFEKAGRDAEKRSDPGLAGRSYFNQGNSWMQKKDPARAIPAFIDAIEQAKSYGDEKLEADARKNLELMLQQQQQNSGGQGEKKDKDSEQKEQSESSQGKDPQQGDQKDPKSDPKDGKDGEDKKDDPKDGEKDDDKKDEQNAQVQQRGKRTFESQKLSKEAAEQVMNELGRREKELQGKLRRQSAPTTTSGKDW